MDVDDDFLVGTRKGGRRGKKRVTLKEGDSAGE